MSLSAVIIAIVFMSGLLYSMVMMVESETAGGWIFLIVVFSIGVLGSPVFGY